MNTIGYKVRRLIAYAADWYLYSVILVIFNLVFAKVIQVESTAYATLELYDNKSAMIALLLMLIIHCVYFVFVPLVWNGQTVGKKLTKLKIINIENNPLTIKQLMLRELLGVLIVEGYLSAYGGYFRTFLAMNIGNIKILAIGWFVISGLSVASGMYSKQNRMFHDMIGKTKVISL